MKKQDKLMVIWSSGDPEVAIKVCLMYTHAAAKNKWFDIVNLIVWGPSVKLLLEDETVKEKVLQMKTDGVIIEACVNCADMYGVADDLRNLDFDVKPMGLPVTQRLKEGWKQLNF
nr:DsrE family protein [uncultured Carboxylicivirga sp.]